MSRWYKKILNTLELTSLLVVMVSAGSLAFCEEKNEYELYETSDGFIYDNRELTEFSLHEENDGLYALIKYKEDGKLDIFRVLKEDIKYLQLATSGKSFVFKKDGRFYRGRYSLGYDSGVFINGKTYARPVLVLERPRAKMVDKDDTIEEYHHRLLRTESETELGYEFTGGYDFLITVEELDSYTPVTKTDIDSLTSKVVTLNFGYSKTRALIVDVGKTRIAKNNVGPVDEVDGTTSILFIPVDQNQLLADWYGDGQLSMPIYSTSIFTIDENYEINPSKHDVITKHDRRGGFCYAPYTYGKQDIIKFRYNFVYSLRLMGPFSASSRERLGDKKYIDINDSDALMEYVGRVREFLRGSSVKTTYLETEVLATPFVDVDKNYTSWMSIDQPQMDVSQKCVEVFGRQKS